jgi:hypothetical protein
MAYLYMLHFIACVSPTLFSLSLSLLPHVRALQRVRTAFEKLKFEYSNIPVFHQPVTSTGRHTRACRVQGLHAALSAWKLVYTRPLRAAIRGAATQYHLKVLGGGDFPMRAFFVGEASPSPLPMESLDLGLPRETWAREREKKLEAAKAYGPPGVPNI